MIYGLTLDDVDAVDKAIPNIKALPFRSLARVVVDEGRPITDYKEPVRRLGAVADVMIQVEDSYNERKLSLTKYVAKFRRLHELFEDSISYWEIGNEVNGTWLSRQIWEKVKGCADYAKENSLKTAICFFLDDSLAPFIDKKYPIRCDLALLSCYPANKKELKDMVDDCEFLLPELKEFCSAKEAGIGEYGEDEWKGRVSAEVREELVTSFDAFNGGFYWNFQKTMVPKSKPLWSVLAETWQERKL